MTQQLVDKHGTRGVYGGGLRSRRRSTRLQKIDIGRSHAGSRRGWPAAALVAVDPRDGAVKAMIGGSNFRESQFNLAVQGERQAGSAFKPFVLATALDNGISPQTTFVSQPTTIWIGDKLWPVSNYEDAYLGSTDVETASIQSDNSVYAQLTAMVGPRNVRRMAHRLGIKSELSGYFAIGLGAEAVNPLEMARAFSTFANGGRRIDGSLFGNRPRAIVSVTRNGERKQNKVVPRRASIPRRRSSSTRSFRRSSRPGPDARALDRPVAGKTGTTENYGDAWFVGYTPQLAVAVWVGYANELIPMLTEYEDDPVAGGTFPALIWKTFIEEALDYLHARPAYFDRRACPILFRSTSSSEAGG
jgi:penicillin-binding protein 1A